jgi:uncharacterized protein (TIGR02266 family)
MDNRRKHNRVKKAIKSEVHSPDAVTFSSTVDISKGGIFISTPDPVDSGSMISLSIQLPGGELVNVKGIVRWVRQNEMQGERAGMGIEFIDLREDDIDKIKKISD